MKCLLILIVVSAVSAAYVPSSESDGIRMPECENKSDRTRTYNVAHKTNCTKFYKCLGPYGFEVDCPTLKGVTLLFNEELQVCDWEGGSNCGNTGGTGGTGGTVPTDTTQATTLSPTDCSVNPERKRPHPDKHKYYQCVNGEAQTKNCPQGNYFNPVIAECDLE